MEGAAEGDGEEGGQEGGGAMERGGGGFHRWNAWVDIGYIYIYKIEWSVCLFVCHIWRGVTGRWGGWTGKRGQERGEQWGGGISMMECQGGDTFPEQHRVTQLVYM